MPVKDAEIEDLRVSALASRPLPGLLVHFASVQIHRLSLRERRDLDRARLICIFIVRSAPTAHARTEMVFRTFQRDADDRRVRTLLRAGAGCGARGRAGVRLRFIAREFVVCVARLFVWRERGRREVGDEVFVEGAALG